MANALQLPPDVLRPHEGPQERFSATPADIAIYGGAAGGGKSYCLLLEPTRHVHKKGFGAVIFRRTFPMITNEGGLWDTAEKIYPLIDGEPRESALEWTWEESGVSISFAHMQHEKNKLDWQGAAIPFIGFDELTHFSRGQFFYMLSRNRLTHDCGVRPYVRATCNPEADGWVADFLAWWIDQETGFPIPDRDGVLRWFVTSDDKIVWADTPDELMDERYPGRVPKSVTFIAAKLIDNPTLMRQDPGYLSNLHALPRFERLQLLEGNWKVRPTAGMFFQREWFEIVDAAPNTGTCVRYWDRAATEATPRTNPDYTAGCKMRRADDGFFYVEHVARTRARPNAVKTMVKNTATQDGVDTTVWLEQDPGQAGVAEVSDLIRALAGFSVYANKVTTSKIARSLPASAQAEAGNIKLVRGPWNEAFLTELESFADRDELPQELRMREPPKDDQVDSFTGAFNALTNVSMPRVF